MSEAVLKLAREGAGKILVSAQEALRRAREKEGDEREVGFPGTIYYLPLAYALLGREVKNLRDLEGVLQDAEALLAADEAGLEEALSSAGRAALFGAEAVAALRYLSGEEPQAGCQGFFTDTILRSLGLQLVDGRIPGLVALVGAAPDNRAAVELVRGFQKKNILVFAGGESGGRSIIDQLREEKVEMGWESYLVPFGRDTISAVFPLNWAVRAALTFGAMKKGQGKAIADYCKQRVMATVVALGPVDEFKVAAAAGAVSLGFPVIADTAVPEIAASRLTLHEALVSEPKHERIVERVIEVRGVKIRVEEIPCPVPYAAAFEGERVRKEHMRAQFGGKYSQAFELLTTGEAAKIKDGAVSLIGPDVDQVPDGGSPPLGIVIEVAGRKMEKDFEPILERQVHSFLNWAMGLMHMGQRDMIWIRLNREAFDKGFRLRHLGEIIIARLHNDFGGIVSKAQVTIMTEAEKVAEKLKLANRIYEQRDLRVAGMTDESVETFYSCSLCQSFAPSHICIISPERLGLCGAYNWLDGKAAHEISPTGANQPVNKTGLIDPVLGQWRGINDFVFEASHRALRSLNLYSIMREPMTSCGCFEAIVAIVPEANGVLVVNREFPGLTPLGMDFITMAGMVGGGVQTPGFMGIGRLYVTSRKFISGDGGLKRLVWMPRDLKEALRSRLEERGREIGVPNFFDLIADETSAGDAAALVKFLQKVDHPALKMEPLL